jgi:hypothetical protein
MSNNDNEIRDKLGKLPQEFFETDYDPRPTPVVTNEDLTEEERHLVKKCMRDFGLSEEEAIERLRAAGM